MESQQVTLKSNTLREVSSSSTTLIVELSNVFKSLSPNDKLRDAAEQLKILLTAEMSFLVAQINKRTFQAQNTNFQTHATVLCSQAGIARIEHVTTQVDTRSIQIQEGVTRIEQRFDRLCLQPPQGIIIDKMISYCSSKCIVSRSN